MFTAATGQITANIENEDTHICTRLLGDRVTLAGVYDGHGGVHCSRFIAANMASTVSKHLGQLVNASTSPPPAAGANVGASALRTALKDTYTHLDRDFIEKHGREHRTVGCCAVTAAVTRDVVVVANCGDSRALLGRLTPSGGIEAHPLSCDHDPNNSTERALVKSRTTDKNAFRRAAAHAHISSAPLRVAGSLMVTRSFGDAYLKKADLSVPPFSEHVPYITAEPELTVHHIGPRDAFLILFTDGLHNLMSNDEIVAQTHHLLRTSLGASGVPQDLIHHAVAKAVAAPNGLSLQEVLTLPTGKRRLMHDDTTVVLLVLNPSAYSATEAPETLTPPNPQHDDVGSTASTPLLKQPSRTSGASSSGSLGPAMTTSGTTQTLTSTGSTSSSGSSRSHGATGPNSNTTTTESVIPLTPTTRLKSQKRAANTSPTAPTSEPRPSFEIGDRVKVRWQRGDIWCVGSIANMTGVPDSMHVRYNVRYDDGDGEDGVRPQDMVPLSSVTSSDAEKGSLTPLLLRQSTAKSSASLRAGVLAGNAPALSRQLDLDASCSGSSSSSDHDEVSHQHRPAPKPKRNNNNKTKTAVASPKTATTSTSSRKKEVAPVRRGQDQFHRNSDDDGDGDEDDAVATRNRSPGPTTSKSPSPSSSSTNKKKAVKRRKL
eukprot:PhM_4_TR17783/c0_g1_i1/m.103778